MWEPAVVISQPLGICLVHGTGSIADGEVDLGDVHDGYRLVAAVDHHRG